MKIIIDTDNKTIQLQNEVSVEELGKFIQSYKLQEYKIEVIKEIVPYYSIYPSYPTYPFGGLYSH
jgi:hypothetical protein